MCYLQQLAYPEDEPKVTSCRREGRLVRTLRLVLDATAVLLLAHHRVTQREKPKELLRMLVALVHLVQQRAVVELERALVVHVRAEVDRLCGLAIERDVD